MARRKSKKSSQSDQATKCRTIEPEGRLCALPDDLLCHVMSFLPLKDATATSVLSRRWRYIWMFSPNLDFSSECLQRMYSFHYVRAINRILRRYKGSKVNDFRIVYPLTGGFTSDINRWVSFAASKSVSRLELAIKDIFMSGLNSVVFLPTHERLYHLPPHVFRSGRQNSVDQLHSTSPITVKPFDSLTDLCLKNISLSDEVFEIILATCSSLENFVLRFIHGLVYPKNTAPHLKLRSLELTSCEGLSKFEVLAPNLVSLKCDGVNKTIFKDYQQLVKLSLMTSVGPSQGLYGSLIDPIGRVFSSQFTSCAPRLETLIISAQLFVDTSYCGELPAFDNLKQLVVVIKHASWVHLGCHVAGSVMMTAPNLRQLELNLPGDYFCEEQPLRLRSKALHPHLKELKICGFRGDPIAMDFALHVIKNATSLQKIDITKRIVDYTTLPFKWDRSLKKRCKRCVYELSKRLRRLGRKAELVFS